jgi:hypothetical protein
MGTSKSYDSPKWPGVNDQVGDAVADGLPTQEKVTAAVGAFAGAYKQFINTGTTGQGGSVTGGSSSAGRTVGGRGGGGGATARTRAATTGARLGHFLSTAASSGLSDSVQQLGLDDLEGRTLEEVLDAVLDRLCEDGGLLDDSALTEAMARTLDELSEGAETVEEFDKLLTSRAENLEEYLQIYFANVLAVNFEQKEGGFVREKIPQEECEQFFKQARELIRTLVNEELSHERDLASIDWGSAEAVSIADEINQEVLDILIGDE